jgi:hypothetical protein
LVAENSYGRTASGREITEELIDEIVAEAEAGYDVDALIARRGARTTPQLRTRRNPDASD